MPPEAGTVRVTAVIAVLCSLTDVAALRLARELGRRNEEVSIITAESLSFASLRSQRITDGTITTQVLAHSTELAGSPRGVVNRMLAPPVHAWAKAPAVEREYVTCELNAFVLSWLAALRCPVRNRPRPECLAGTAPHPAVALAAAAKAGLAIPPLRYGSRRCPMDAYPMGAAHRGATADAYGYQVTCLDTAVVGGDVPSDVRAAIARFAYNIGAEDALIGIDFVIDRGRWTYAGMTPVPSLDGVVEAVADRLIEVFRGDELVSP